MSSPDALVAEGWQAHQARNAFVAEQKYREALGLAPEHPSGLAMLAALLRQTGRAAEALDVARHAARVTPGASARQLEIGLCQRALGQIDDAVETMTAAISLDPNDTELPIQLATMLISVHRSYDACEVLEDALQHQPDQPRLTALLASTLLEIGRPSDAIVYFEKAVAAQPDAHMLRYQLGLAHQQSGDLNSAARVFQETVDAQPSFIDAHVALADIDISWDKTDDADQRLRGLIQSGQITIPLALTFARLCRRLKDPDPGIQLIEQIVTHPSMAPLHRAHLLLTAGQLHEDKEEYDRALDAYTRGKAEYPKTYDPDARTAAAGLMEDLFTESVMSSAPRADLPESARAVFIIGMPRSGTSLIEQILSSHPSVYGAGELDTMRAVVASMQDELDLEDRFPWNVPNLTASQLKHVGERYLAHLRTLDQGASLRVTDKMPHNYAYLALINLALPSARIIHCARDPMDTCLSCFATRLGTGYDFATSLENVGHEYRVYQRIMNHWKRVVDLPILEVSYESMVADQEGETRRLIKFLDLLWDDACLEFHQSKRVVATNSIDQVRQPIYNKSVGRAARFGARLEPLRRALYG